MKIKRGLWRSGFIGYRYGYPILRPGMLMDEKTANCHSGSGGSMEEITICRSLGTRDDNALRDLVILM